MSIDEEVGGEDSEEAAEDEEIVEVMEVVEVVEVAAAPYLPGPLVTIHIRRQAQYRLKI